MAVGIANLNGTIDTSNPSAFPHGAIQDDPAGVNGTHVDRAYLNDLIQFFDKLMRSASIAISGNEESETNGYQYLEALGKLIQNQSVGLGYTSVTNAAKWIDTGGITVVSASGGGSFTLTAGDVVYSKYKPIGLKTWVWTCKIRTATVSGTVSAVRLDFGTTTGGSWAAGDVRMASALIRDTMNFYSAIVATVAGTTQVDISRVDTLALPTGTNNIDIDFQVIFEMA